MEILNKTSEDNSQKGNLNSHPENGNMQGVKVQGQMGFPNR